MRGKPGNIRISAFGRGLQNGYKLGLEFAKEAAVELVIEFFEEGHAPAELMEQIRLIEPDRDEDT